MARRIRVHELEKDKNCVVVWGIEELEKVDPRDENYKYDISTKFHQDQQAIEFLFSLKYEQTINFTLVLGFNQNKQAIECLLNGCKLFLVYTPATTNPDNDFKNIRTYSDVYQGTTIPNLPVQVIKDIKKFKKTYNKLTLSNIHF